MARRHSRMRSCQLQTEPTTTFGFSYWMKPQSPHTRRSRLSPSGTRRTKPPVGPGWLMPPRVAQTRTRDKPGRRRAAPLRADEDVLTDGDGVVRVQRRDRDDIAAVVQGAGVDADVDGAAARREDDAPSAIGAGDGQAVEQGIGGDGILAAGGIR